MSTSTHCLPSTGEEHVEMESLWRIWEEQHARLCRVVARRASLPFEDYEVQDAASDALLRLHRLRQRRRNEPAAVERWLAVVAWREFLRRTGRDARRRAIETSVFVREERVTSVARPEDGVLRREQARARRRALEVSLRTLPDGQRETLELLAAGASYARIAQHRGVSTRAVDRALGKARRRLRSNALLVREVAGCNT
jgi:RNA polymerase sigma factor (sigma-70 family)